MVDETEKIEALKSKLKSATKEKLFMERETLQYRNLYRSLIEDLSMIKEEINFLQSQLEELKEKISKTLHQISMIEICKSSEKMKIEAHINNLRTHRNGFNSLFSKLKEEIELQNKDIRDREAKKQDMIMQKQKQVLLKNEEQMKETALVETDCEALERECVVLKKRNAAIMLKLRRKLIETEDIRRELLKKHRGEETCT